MPRTISRILNQATLLELCEREFGLPPERAVSQLKKAVRELDPFAAPSFDHARIRKIKLTKSEKTGKMRIRVDYLLPVSDDEDWKECSQVDKADDLTIGFWQALENLVPHAMEVLELDEGYGENVRCTGLSISYADDEDSTRTVVLTLQKDLAETNSPFVFNTPAKPCNPYGGGEDDFNCLPEKMVKAIDAVIDQARAYLGGERQTVQLSLGDWQDV